MSLPEKTESLLNRLNSRATGLTDEEVRKRTPFKTGKASELKITLKIFYRNINSPLTILLLFVALFSVYVHDSLNASIVFSIVGASTLISFIQEIKAHRATVALSRSMKIKQWVWRGGIKVSVYPEELVVGDILAIYAGDLIPLNCQLIESTDIYANESSLSGEALPKEKQVDQDPYLYMGTSMVSGLGKAIILPQDAQKNLSDLFAYISKGGQMSAFGLHLHRFARFLMKVTLIFVSLIFIILLVFKYPPLQSLLFSLSIAVGLSPQLLPAILTTNLAIGAKKMAKLGALTKKLESIENFGNIDLLCCDKTGTLTQGKIDMYAALDLQGLASEWVEKLGYINAVSQTGYQNSLDEAIITHHKTPAPIFIKLDEIPYDFNRKILSILAQVDSSTLLIAKGALENILVRCKQTPEEKNAIMNKATSFYAEGFRLLGLASKPLSTLTAKIDDEIQMDFQGFLLFFDPVKPDSKLALTHLKDLGIRVVMITGDHPVIASHIGKQVGFIRSNTVESADLNDLSRSDFTHALDTYDIFARMAPLDKAKLIEGFKKMGYTVGYLGDGINDSCALYTADVGISVETGAAATKAVADFILTHKSLHILAHAVKEGRKIFGNTQKYIFMAISANFGNMLSMACVALFIPFLPLLPTQILLINLLQDIPEMGISLDNVDASIIKMPQKWNLCLIRYFMIIFGLISSFFDFATFFINNYFAATPEQFRSAWFTESVLSATFIILFIRTKKVFYKSKPSLFLLFSVFGIILFTLGLPYTPLGPLFDIMVLPSKFYIAIFIIVLSYALAVEAGKKVFYRWMHKTHLIA